LSLALRTLRGRSSSRCTSWLRMLMISLVSSNKRRCSWQFAASAQISSHRCFCSHPYTYSPSFRETNRVEWDRSKVSSRCNSRTLPAGILLLPGIQALCHLWMFGEKHDLLSGRRSSGARRWYTESLPYVATPHKPLWLSSSILIAYARYYSDSTRRHD
jgi:hypothetical protein